MALTRPRLVATDLDGTIVRSDGSVSTRTREVLLDLDGRGVPVVFVTGRPLRWMEELWSAVGAHGLAIVANGAVVYDVTSRRVRDVRGITREQGLRLVEVIDAGRSRRGVRDRDGRRPPARGRLPGTTRPAGGDASRPTRGRVGPGRPQGPGPAPERCPSTDFRESVTEALGDLAAPSWSMEGLVEVSARRDHQGVRRLPG